MIRRLAVFGAAVALLGAAAAPARARDYVGLVNPWIELTWPEPITADRVVLYDRTSGDDANGGVLRVGDGSTVEVTGIPGNGAGKTVTFAMRTFDRLRFQVQGGSGSNVGLLELEVHARP